MSQPPKIVVTIPLYNGRQHLDDAIRSVLMQESVNVDLIIVDDRSEDDPGSILSKYPRDRYCYVRNAERLGMVGNHNRCLDFNKGDFFKILSQDDELTPGSLLKQIQGLTDYAQAVFASGTKEIINGRGKKILFVDYGMRGLVDYGEVCRALAWKGTNVCGEPACVLIRGKALRDTGTRFCGRPWLLDIRMWMDLLKLGPGLMMPDTVAKFRVTPGSYSVNFKSDHYREFSGLLVDIFNDGLISPSALTLGKIRCKINAIGIQWVYKIANAG